jgi:hypothetical protein
MPATSASLRVMLIMVSSLFSWKPAAIGGWQFGKTQSYWVMLT